MAAMTGCERAEPAAEAARAQIPTHPFTSRFELLDTIVLEQPDTLPIVRISGIDRRPDGHLVLSDPSEGMVKLFAPDGRLVRVIGRKGRGPAEFQLPEFAQFDASGRVHVVDNMLRRISLFDQNGTFVRSLELGKFQRVTDFEVLPNGGYVFAGFQPPPERNVFFLADSLGRTLSGHMPHAEYVPRGEPGGPVWRMVRRPSISVEGDSAHAVLSISDSVWTVDWTRGSVRSQHVAPADYRRPYSVSPGQVRGLPAVMKWTKSFTTTAEVFSSSDMVLIPFVRGVLNEGDPLTVAYRGAGGGWESLAGSPPLLAVAGAEVLALHRPGADQVVIARYRKRP